MAKTTKRKTATSRTKRTTARRMSSEPALLSSDSKGFWGKDQPMVLALSAGIVIMIVLALFLTGWL